MGDFQEANILCFPPSPAFTNKIFNACFCAAGVSWNLTWLTLFFGSQSNLNSVTRSNFYSDLMSDTTFTFLFLLPYYYSIALLNTLLVSSGILYLSNKLQRFPLSTKYISEFISFLSVLLVYIHHGFVHTNRFSFETSLLNI